MLGRPGKVTMLNLVLTDANTEYSFSLPQNTTHLTMQPRGAGSVKIYLSPGGDGSNYFTIKTGGCYFDTNISANQTMYAQTPNAGETLEIMAWSIPA